MTTLERIGLEDLQELAEYFENIKVVDLKINTSGGEQPTINWSSSQEPPRESMRSQNINMRESQPDFYIGGESRPSGTRSRKNQTDVNLDTNK